MAKNLYNVTFKSNFSFRKLGSKLEDVLGSSNGKIIDELADNLFDKKVPMITCPKTFCGCGMCITKSKNDIDTLFKQHVIDELEYKSVSQKKSNWFTDLTTKRIFMELDESKQTI